MITILPVCTLHQLRLHRYKTDSILFLFFCHLVHSKMLVCLYSLWRSIYCNLRSMHFSCRKCNSCQIKHTSDTVSLKCLSYKEQTDVPAVCNCDHSTNLHTFKRTKYSHFLPFKHLAERVIADKFMETPDAFISICRCNIFCKYFCRQMQCRQKFLYLYFSDIHFGFNSFLLPVPPAGMSEHAQRHNLCFSHDFR